MAYAVAPACIGCGACEVACPKGAISQAEGFVITYVIDPLLCNDCGACIPPCPLDVIVPDPAWPVCHGRGCPLSSNRYAGWECSEGGTRCPACGDVMWRPPGSEWICGRCRPGAGGRGARCPKTRRATALTGQAGATVPGAT